MGLEVGSVVFEDDNILTCGTPRLKHLAEHPTLPSIMAGEVQGVFVCLFVSLERFLKGCVCVYVCVCVCV